MSFIFYINKIFKLCLLFSLKRFFILLVKIIKITFFLFLVDNLVQKLMISIWWLQLHIPCLFESIDLFNILNVKILICIGPFIEMIIIRLISSFWSKALIFEFIRIFRIKEIYWQKKRYGKLKRVIFSIGK
jgi:hypothetical protein